MSFSLGACAFGIYLRIHCQIQSHKDLSQVSFKNFGVLTHTFRSINHFELIFINGVRSMSKLILLHANIHFFPAPFVEKTSLCPLNGFGTLVSNQGSLGSMCEDLILGSLFCSIALTVCCCVTTTLF